MTASHQNKRKFAHQKTVKMNQSYAWLQSTNLIKKEPATVAPEDGQSDPDMAVEEGTPKLRIEGRKIKKA
jgi:hypothetical protein